MDLKHIQDLVKMVNKSNITELSIEEKDFKITIKQNEERVVAAAPAPVYQQPAVVQAPAPVSAAASAAAPQKQEADNLITIKSPMIGTFYRKPAPGKPNFVEEGDEVRSGKVVCVIEAMKLFNEIESEVNGRIVKILVEDSSPVEYDQPLFMIEPA